MNDKVSAKKNEGIRRKEWKNAIFSKKIIILLAHYLHKKR